MADTIFLSAGVPDPKRGPDFAATADSVAITSAVSALVHVALGRRMVVWGGHPAITPMIWVVAKDIGVEYNRWVRLYQSTYFQDDFPEENSQFGNVTYVDAVREDREASLLAMRTRMFAENEFGAAVFIGGMTGLIQEFELFCKYQPKATTIPVFSTGGAVLMLPDSSKCHPEDSDLDYVRFFHERLHISVREDRFPNPDSQPGKIQQRFWGQGRPSIS